MNLTAVLALLQDSPPPPAAQEGSGWLSMLPMVAIIGIFYFVLIAPERKNRKRREEMLKKLSKGDKVMTSGGMFATVAAIDGDRVTLQLDEGVRVRFTRAAIQEVVSDDAPAASSKPSKS